jgi:hypothetical protein
MAFQYIGRQKLPAGFSVKIFCQQFPGSSAALALPDIFQHRAAGSFLQQLHFESHALFT